MTRSLRMVCRNPPKFKDKAAAPDAAMGRRCAAEPLPGTHPVLPEGLLRPRRGPLNPRTGRRAAN